VTLLGRLAVHPMHSCVDESSKLPRHLGVLSVLLLLLPACVCTAATQVKKRGRWLHRFSLDVLSKLPGSPDDPFEGVTVDTNSLGKPPYLTTYCHIFPKACQEQCHCCAFETGAVATAVLRPKLCYAMSLSCSQRGVRVYPEPCNSNSNTYRWLCAGWALAVVSSRAFRVSGPHAPAALLPLIDMANHSFEPNCEVLPVPGGVAMVAKRPVSRQAAALQCIASPVLA
jgi:hypothetical protein